AARICRPVPQKSSLPLSVTSTFFFILNVRKIRSTHTGLVFGSTFISVSQTLKIVIEGMD
ncbi:hypothetical protein, partial [Thomasclavelia cocleata]|uniref:hypothetical protein n=1 Tax=Thomasclavelia cocleata TaxID=69824 RepID=UPI00255B1086